MSLTTSEISGGGPFFPSEQWFYYWKTSANLWEAQLSANGNTTVHIPINWAFHCEDGETVDFGENLPETDLARLANLCETLNQEALFFLPITPLPLFPNGGIPRLLARLPGQQLIRHGPCLHRLGRCY